MKEIKKIIPVVLLLFVFFIIEINIINKTSITNDETVHIFAGYSYITTHNFSINPEHPPLCKILAGLSILHLHPKLPSFVHKNFNKWLGGEWSEGERFFFKNKVEINQLLFWARLPMVFLSLILGFFIFLWSKELYGYYAGLFSLFIFTFCPNFLAHSALVTTDTGEALFVFLTIYMFYKYLSQQNKLWLLFFGLCLGLAFATKFTTPVLIPPALLTICLFLLTRKEYKDKISTLKKQVFSLYGLLCIIIIPFFVLSSFYFFVHTGEFFTGFHNVLQRLL
ncbi:MAG: glycosyltransferase family 39 protein [Actinobacteria bacterium]|nr:glycosyltransferase family 39 protein [Actinomycetota bacterium]